MFQRPTNFNPICDPKSYVEIKTLSPPWVYFFDSFEMFTEGNVGHETGTHTPCGAACMRPMRYWNNQKYCAILTEVESLVLGQRRTDQFAASVF